VIGRLIGDGHPAEVRRGVVPVTAARLGTTSLYRLAPVVLATIAAGLDVSIGELGVALTIAELCGLTSPLMSRIVERTDRRATMLVGLAGVAVGAFVIALTDHIVGFTVGLFLLSIFKLVFDMSQGAWIADHVPFAQRGRIVGFNETSWALGLLVGVSTLALVIAATSWLWAYAVGGSAVVLLAALLARRVSPDGRPPPTRSRSTFADDSPVDRSSTAPGPVPSHIGRAGWLAVLSTTGLMVAAQTIFVTFGPWLEDDRGVSTAALAAVTFGLGGVELGASLLSTGRTDRWGKERSVLGGAALMVVSGTLAFVVGDSLLLGLPLLGLFLAGFEFALVSAIPIATTLVPGRPAAGLGRYFTAMTIARALTTVPATILLDRAGFRWCMGAAGVAAVAGAAAMEARRRMLVVAG
jgi:predicted MFS family arabinose efflux permease